MRVEKLQQNVIIVNGSRIGRNTKSNIKKTKATEAAAAAWATTTTTATSPFRIPRCHGLPPGDGGALPRLHRVEHLRQLGVLLADLVFDKNIYNDSSKIMNYFQFYFNFFPGSSGEYLTSFFLIHSPPGERGVHSKSIFRLLLGTRGRCMPKLVEIHLVVLAPDPNKQTDRQTQTDLYLCTIFYYYFLFNYIPVPSCSSPWPSSRWPPCPGGECARGRRTGGSLSGKWI